MFIRYSYSCVPIEYGIFILVENTLETSFSSHVPRLQGTTPVRLYVESMVRGEKELSSIK